MENLTKEELNIIGGVLYAQILRFFDEIEKYEKKAQKNPFLRLDLIKENYHSQITKLQILKEKVDRIRKTL